MRLIKLTCAAAITVGFGLFSSNSVAGPLIISIIKPAPPLAAGFKLGTARRPDGATLTLDGRSLLLNGQPWMPVMGEFHFSRYPADEWREELLKMKAGGVDTVATYVFWIHHEETEGKFDWSGQRDLRRFTRLCGEVGLNMLVRCGPWDHGEVRHGGFPDWLMQKGWKLRSNDSNYLAQVRILYAQISQQLDGLLWKDGGPVIGIQLENEYSGPAEHLLTLKRLARDAGMDVPLYTRTGWPLLRTPMAFGEIVPLYGVYAEGFWDRKLAPMPGNYWRGFHFSSLRTDEAVGTDVLGQRQAKDARDADQYPFLTCEIGAGMMSSYHRRIRFTPEDALSTALVKLGSGGSSLGYYMYHGGENPDGKLTTLEECQTAGGYNDMPVKNYDFQTALGQYGQIRPQYHSLRRLHLFLKEWGTQLAEMPATMPETRPRGSDDFETLRWSARSDGISGFVFLNNYQRLHTLPPKKDVQFQLNLPDGPLTFPSAPITIPSDACCFWPFQLDLGQGVKLAWATAQPLTAIENGNVRTVFFAETMGVPAEFAFDGTAKLKLQSGHREDGRQTVVRDIKPGFDAALQIAGTNGHVRIVLLDEAQSLALWKGRWHGRDRVFLSHVGLVFDQDELRLSSPNREDLKLAVYPAPDRVELNGRRVESVLAGIFTGYTLPLPAPVAYSVRRTKVQPAGPARRVPMGNTKQPVAAAPKDADFSSAEVWSLKLPDNLDLSLDPLLQVRYVGDVARVTLNGKLLADDFYNGNPFEMALRRYSPAITNGQLQIQILPLSKDAPIYLASEAQPASDRPSVVSLSAIELVPRYKCRLEAY